MRGGALGGDPVRLDELVRLRGCRFRAPAQPVDRLDLDGCGAELGAQELDGVREGRNVVRGHRQPDAVGELGRVEAAQRANHAVAGAFPVGGEPALVVNRRQSVAGHADASQMRYDPIDLLVAEHAIGGHRGAQLQFQLRRLRARVLERLRQDTPVHRRLAASVVTHLEVRRLAFGGVGGDEIDPAFGRLQRHELRLGVASGSVAVRAPQIARRGEKKRDRDRLRGAVAGGRRRSLRPGVHDIEPAQQTSKRTIGIGRRVENPLFELRDEVNHARIGDECRAARGSVDDVLLFPQRDAEHLRRKRRRLSFVGTFRSHSPSMRHCGGARAPRKPWNVL